MDEGKPLPSSRTLVASAVTHARPVARGLHSFNFWLNSSAFCGTGDACRGCFGGVLGVSAGNMGYVGCILCQKRLTLS